MSKPLRIRTPWSQKWRRIQFQVLPLVIFVSAGAVAMWLWGRHVGLPHAVGEVHAKRADAVSLSDGRLVRMDGQAPGLFDTVTKDLVLARLDTGPLQATLETYEKESAGLVKALDAAEEQFIQDWEARHHNEMAEKRRLEEAKGQWEQDIHDRQTIIEADKVAMARLDENLAIFQGLVIKGIEAPWKEANLKAERDVTKKRIEGNEVALKEAQTQMQAAEKRLREHVLTKQADLDKLLAPLRAAVETQQKRIAEVQLQMAALEIRAPMDGTITAIHSWPGQNVRAGTPIMTVAASEGQCIVSYVRQETRIRPVVGMAVDVSVRSLPRLTARARVEEVGPQVEPVPTHQLRDSKLPEWGLPVRISVPAELGLKPGELVDVAFKTGMSFGRSPLGSQASVAAGEVQVVDRAPISESVSRAE